MSVKDDEPDTMPSYIMQAAERRMVHDRQQMEHDMAEKQHSDKTAMNDRHQKEVRDMQKRHESDGEDDSMPEGKEPAEKSEGEPDF